MSVICHCGWAGRTGVGGERVLAEEAGSVFVRDGGEGRKEHRGGHTQHETRARESPLHPPTCLCFSPGHILGWSRGGGRQRATAMPLSILTFPQCRQSLLVEEQPWSTALPSLSISFPARPHFWTQSPSTPGPRRDEGAEEKVGTFCAVISSSELCSPAVTCLGRVLGPFPNSKVTLPWSLNYSLTLWDDTHPSYP